MNRLTIIVALSVALFSQMGHSNDLAKSIEADYRDRLGAMFRDFHINPELSTGEFRTAKKLAQALRKSGFKVTEGVGGTGVVALLKNGPGPLVMMRGDMDGLPLLEKTGLEYASKAMHKDPITGNTVPVMHACGHDSHVASLLGMGALMAQATDQWSGTLQLIFQPGEEIAAGAVYLCSDAGAAMRGAAFTIDGGWIAR